MPIQSALSLLIETVGQKGLDAISDSFIKLDGLAKLTAQDLTRYELAAKAGIITSDNLSSAVSAIAANTNRAATATHAHASATDRASASEQYRVATLQRQAEALDRVRASEERAAAAADARAAKAEAQAQREQQRIGQQTERAIQEAKRREEAAQRRNAAENAAEEAARIRGLRGVTGLGTIAGILPSGSSSALSAGTSLLGAAGVPLAGPIAAAAAAFAGLAAGVVKAANSLGDYAREQSNVSARTGLTTVETQLFGRVADVAGVNAGSLTTSMRTLSKAFNENSEEGKKGKAALRELGLGMEVAFLPTRKALETIFEALSKVNGGLEQERIAIALLGRGALELAPLFGSFKELSRQVEATGVIISKEGIAKAADYRREAKLLGLEWDGVVNKFKQKAVGIVQIVVGAGKQLSSGAIGDAGGAGGKLSVGLLVADAINDLFINGRNPITQLDKDQNPRNTIAGALERQAALGIPSGTAENRKQQQERLDSLNDKLATPKERLEIKLKAAKGDKEAAEQRFATDVIVSDQSRDEKAIRSADQRVKSIQAQIDGLKVQKGIDNEILTLREKLRSVTDGESTGVARINSETTALLAKLQERKKLGEVGSASYREELSLINQINAAQKVRFDQTLGLVTIAEKRQSSTELFAVRRTLQREDILGSAKIQEATGKQSGDDEGGIARAKQTRQQLAQLEFDLAAKHVQDLRATAAADFAVNGDVIKNIRDRHLIERAELAATAAFAKTLKGSDNIAALETIALRKRESKEREEDSKRAIETARTLDGLAFQRNRTIAEGQTRLAVTNAGPGFELQARLNADAARLRADREEAARDTVRNNAAILAKKAEVVFGSGDQRALVKEINALELQGKQDAFKIENDIIRARIDAEQQIAQKRKSDEESFKATAAGFFGAAQQGKGQDFLRGIGQGLLSKIEGNVAGLAFPTADKARNSFASRVSGTADDPTFIGKMLAGTPFGPLAKNPIEKAADMQIAAVKTEVDAHVATQKALYAVRDAVVGETGASGLLSKTESAIATGRQLPTGDTPKTTGLGGTLPSIFTPDATGFGASSALKTAASIGAAAAGAGGILSAASTGTGTLNAITQALKPIGDGLRPVVTSTFSPISATPGAAALAAVTANAASVAGSSFATSKSIDTAAQGLTKTVLGFPTAASLAPRPEALIASIKPLAASLAALAPAPFAQPAINALSATSTAAGLFGGVKALFGGGTGIANAPTVSATDLAKFGLTTPSGLAASTAAAAPKSTQSFTGLSGFASGLGSVGDFKGIFTGIGAQPGGGAQTLSGTERFGAAIGTAAAVYGAERGIAQAFKGGASNITGGLAQAAASIAPLTGPAAPFVAAGAAVLSIVNAALGDPRLKTREKVEKELNQGVFQPNVSITRRQDSLTNTYTDFDKFGKLQGSNLSPIPQVKEPYITRRNGQYFDVGGQTVSPYGGAPPPQQQAPAPVINITAWDSQSVHQYFQANPEIANSIVHTGLTQASGPAQQSVKEAAGLG
ncbi:MAG: hypothetical protein NVS9B4_01040 [Candidatus Acidiferrum sp.]